MAIITTTLTIIDLTMVTITTVIPTRIPTRIPMATVEDAVGEDLMQKHRHTQRSQSVAAVVLLCA